MKNLSGDAAEWNLSGHSEKKKPARNMTKTTKKVVNVDADIKQLNKIKDGLTAKYDESSSKHINDALIGIESVIDSLHYMKLTDRACEN